MGFTRFYHQYSKWKKSDWDKFIKKINSLKIHFEEFYNCNIIIFGDRLIVEDTSENKAGDLRIYKEQREHMLDENNVQFNFVKTNYNPYDTVCDFILRLAHDQKRDFTYTSD
tara:strand:+ start:526 stop:861 length:336 start_codon:yes stop_codon:yes gene_type:complete